MVASTMGSPLSAKSPPHGIKPLTSYFSASQSPRKPGALVFHVDLENDANGSGVARRPYSVGTGTASCPLQIDEPCFDTVSALMRVKNCREIPKKRTFRAGDEGVFILHQGGLMGRDLTAQKERTPKKLRTKKIHLGIICGGTSGISRKQLEVRKVMPLKIRQLATAANQVGTYRYNPLLKKMERVRIAGKGQDIELKAGDVIEMDTCVRQQELQPEHVFRVVNCLVPRQTDSSKKRAFAVAAGSSPADAIDLVVPAKRKTPKTRVVPTPSSQGRPIDMVRSSTTTTSKGRNTSDSRMSMNSLKTVSYSRSSEDSHNTQLVMSSQDTRLSSQSFTAQSKVSKNKNQNRETQRNSSSPRPEATQSMLESDISARKSPQFKAKTVALPHNTKRPNLKSNAKTVQFDDPEDAPKKEAPASGMKSRATLPPKVDDKLHRRKSPTPAVSPPQATLPKVGDRVGLTRQDPPKVVQPTSMAQVPPKVGDHFRVLFKSTDVFRLKRETWWYAKATKVTRLRGKTANGEQKYNIKVLFSDNSDDEYSFPNEEIQKLEFEENTSIMHVVPTACQAMKKVAFEMNPDKLELGDLVDAHYQNGAEYDKWYRGRVASIDSEAKTCTVVYEDGDAEANIPIGQGKIMLVERGSQVEWLETVDFWDDFTLDPPGRSKRLGSKRRTTRRKIGSVVKQNGNFVVIGLKVSSGVVKEERLKYTEFISYLFESLLSTYASIKVWPGTKISSKKRSRTIRMAAIKDEDVETTRGFHKEKEQIDVLKDVARRKGSETMAEPVCHVTTKPGATKARRPRLKEEFREDEWDMSNNVEDRQINEKAIGMKEMRQTVSSSYFRALTSSDPLVGSDLLIQTAIVNKRGLNLTIGRSIRELMFDGPENEGTLFPDSHRIGAALRYLDILTTIPGGEENLSNACSPRDWSTLHEMLESIMKLQYIYEGDETCASAAAWDRVISSLTLSGSAALFLTMLLKAELREQLSSQQPEKAKCRAGPLAEALWSNSNGVRNSMKTILIVFVNSWLRYGHYALCNHGPILSSAGGPSAAAIRRCRDEAKWMLNNLGKAVSLVLWVYSTCEGIGLKNNELADLFKEVYEVEVNRCTFDPSVFMTSKKAPTGYWKKLKLRLVLNLDTAIVGSVQARFAKVLGIEKEYKAIIE